MRMQIADVRVTLGGEIESMKVDKRGVSVAEAMVLNAVHGANAVHNIRNIRPANVSAMSHKRYLTERYMRRSGDENKRDVANLLFPGLAPNFPETFEEAGLLAARMESAEMVDDGVGNGIQEIGAETMETGVVEGDEPQEGEQVAELEPGAGAPVERTSASAAVAEQREQSRSGRRQQGMSALAAAMQG